MKRIIFENALLPSGWAKNVCLELDDAGEILKVTPDYDGAKVDDSEKMSGYALPAMNNVHSHAFQRAMAGLAEYSTSASDSFWTWRDIMYRFAGKISAVDLEAIASQLYLEMLKAGYASVAEFHYLHHDQGRNDTMSHSIMAAADKTRIGLCHLPVLYMASGFGGAPLNARQQRFGHSLDDYQALLEKLSSSISHNSNQHLGMAFHSLRAVPEYALKECLNNNPVSGPVHIHISEQIQEVNDCVSWSGKRPVEWLYDRADVNERWCLIHATHLNDDEINMIARSGAVAGLCPTTEANLGDGLFPLKNYLDQGGDIAIGSDSHISVSVIEELRLLEYGQRLESRQRNIAVSDDEIHTGSNLYNLTLRGGAKASGFNNGMIDVGKRA
ncbi:MAG: formimidoylglutamate deiminase, partial [Kordiimonadaceae bacterium]|nr:formimidoylglutamate deiminase [Kordiimonadaceae bacterium]